VLHAVKSDKRACAPKASLAVDSNRPFLFLCDLQELGHDIVRWGCAVQKVQLIVLDASFDEFLSVVLRLVEADDGRNAHLFKNRQVVLRGKRPVAIGDV
jgi:hypothetical protein